MAEQKIFILDTNVLLHDPESIFSFENSLVGIPILALEELDKFKDETSQRGYSCREVIRHLDVLRKQGSLRDGIDLENGGKLKVLFLPLLKDCVLPFDMDLIDNKVLFTAYCLKEKGYDVRFISKDINARVKADVLGIIADDFIRDTVSKEHLYRGWINIQVPSVQLKKDVPEELYDLVNEQKIVSNQFILLESKHNPFNNKLYRYLGDGQFKHVLNPELRWPLEPRNVQQLMVLDLLLDNNVQLVTLVGPAGTGKTFLALLAGLHKVLIENEYEKILVSRPVIPLGPDIGYLPGDIQEKLFSWMQPVYDNMDFITHSVNIPGQMGIYRSEENEGYDQRGYTKNKKKKKFVSRKLMPTLDELIKEGKISLEAITYMRGRSIPYQFILIDEVQNLTPHEVKTLITRVGEGSKIILAGDPYQIDSPYLDFSSNGLVVATAKFKGQQIFGTVYLEISERSELSRLANELL